MQLFENSPAEKLNKSCENTKQALASLALEGIYPSKEMLEDINLLDAGKISSDEFLSRAFARATS